MAVIRLEIHLPGSSSLKAKRAVVKPLVEGIRQRFGASVAEVGYHDKWQRAEIGVALVSGSAAQAGRVVESVERWVWSRADLEVYDFRTEWHAGPEGWGR